MKERVVHTVCPLGGDHTYCILKVLVKEGKIYKVESSDLPQWADDKCVCARGLSSYRLAYHPDRLKYPLKRVGARGEGKWQRVSWDEALGLIADKLLETKKRYGAQAVYIRSAGSSTVGRLGQIMGSRFANAWGSSTFQTKGYFADGGMPAASLMVLGDSGQGHGCRDYLGSKILILWGWNPAETSLREVKDILDARDRGVKLVVISPLYTPTAAKADQWVPLRLGTDGALALGMAKVIIERELYDRDYILSHTVGPLLVREDNKMFLRGSNLGKGESYMVFDQRSGSPVSLDSPDVAPALFGSFTVNGIRCKPAFQLLADRAAEYPLERVSEITGVPAETIGNLAVEYATSKPAGIKMCDGLARTYHSAMACRAIITLGAITGNIGIRGGGVSTHQSAYRVALDYAAVTNPPGVPGTKDIPGTTNGFKGWTAIRDGAVKVLIIRFQNLAQAYGNHRGYLDIFSRMDLVVVFDTFMSWTAQYADIVLPETTVFEQSDIELSHHHLVRMQKAIEPLYEARPAFEVWPDLAQRVGLGHYFKQTEEDVIGTLLGSGHPSLAGITPGKLLSEVVVRANVPSVPRTAFEDMRFRTPSGRVEFYTESLAQFGEELPVHKEHLESPRSSPLAGRYPLSLFTIKTKLRQQTITACDWILELAPGPFLDINPVDAAARGIRDGDIVEVFNDRGKARLKARLIETMPPGAVNIDHGWLPQQFISGHYSELFPTVYDPQQINPAFDIEPIISDTRAAGHTLTYDCLVEVKRGV